MKASRPYFLRPTLPVLAIACGLAGCTAVPPAPERSAGAAEGAAAAGYYLGLTRLSAGDFVRERAELSAAATPEGQLRLALLLGHPRQQPPELARALALLEPLARSAAATPAQRALARLLIDNYGERLRQESLLKESQRKALELQEKLDALADIERTLPAASRTAPAGKPAGAR